MSRKIDHFIAELVQDDMLDINKMRKAELKSLVRDLIESNYREMTNETIVDIHEETFHTYVRSFV